MNKWTKRHFRKFGCVLLFIWVIFAGQCSSNKLRIFHVQKSSEVHPMDSHRVRKKISILVAELRLRLILNFFVVAFMFFILAQKLEARFEMRRIQWEESFVLFTKKRVLLLNRRDNVIWEYKFNYLFVLKLHYSNK